MNADMISRGIHTPRATSRIKAVWLADLLEETQALPALRKQYRVERSEEIKRAIQQAGQRLRIAVDRHYTTIDAICEHFLIDRMIFEMPTVRESRLIRRMAIDSQSLSANLGLGVVGTTLGGMALGASGAMMAANSANGLQTDAKRHDLDKIMRTMPVKPRTEDVLPYIKTLRTSRDPRERVQAILRMGSIRNPQVLPDIAIAYKKDDATEVRDTAERIGKRIYWNAVYLAMENSGLMAQEITRRAREAGKLVEREADVALVTEGGPRRDDASPEEIAAMLARAQRSKRHG